MHLEKKKWVNPVIQVLAVRKTEANVNFDTTTESAIQIVIDPTAASQVTENVSSYTIYGS